jgi:hypothetical protein
MDRRQALRATTCANPTGRQPAKGRGSSRLFAKAVGGLLWIGLLAGPAGLWAVEPPDPPRRESDGFLKRLDKKHAALSQDLSALAERIDLFMGGLRVCQDSTETYVQAGGTVIMLKDGGLRFDHILQANIILPNTQDRFKLLLERTPDNLQPLSPGARSATESATLAQAGSNVTNVTAALQYVRREQQKWLFNADAGVEVTWPPDPFGKLRFSRLFPLGEDLRINFSETLFWYTSIGAGQRAQIDLEMYLSNCMLFRTTAEALWREQQRERGFDLGLNLFLFHELTWRDVVVYRAGATALTGPEASISSWGAGIQYRRRLYKNWLHMTVEPAVVFAKENGYQGDPSIRLGFDLTFGEKYIHPEDAK